MHCDIKPDNILVVEGVGKRLQVKLADLGVAVVLDRSRTHSSLRGDSEFVPPWCDYGEVEQLNKKEPGVINTFKHADAYAVGMCLIRLASLDGGEEGTVRNEPKIKDQLTKIEIEYGKEFRACLERFIEKEKAQQPSVNQMYSDLNPNQNGTGVFAVLSCLVPFIYLLPFSHCNVHVEPWSVTFI